MPSKHHSKSRLWLTIVLVQLLLAGCSTATLREAQQHFSAGASAENGQTIAALMRYELGTTEVAIQQAETEYRLACDIVDEAITQKGETLRADRLLGTAEMLRVYSRWRLLALEGGESDVGTGACRLDYDAVSNASRQIRTQHDQGQISLGARDAAMADAMPGFLDLERARNAAAAGDWTAANERFCSAIRIQDKAARAAPSDHSVRTYLYLAQIQGIGSWQSAVRRLSTDVPTRNRRFGEIRAFAGPAVCGLSKAAKAREPSGKGALTTLMRNQLVSVGLDTGFDCASSLDLPATCPDKSR